MGFIWKTLTEKRLFYSSSETEEAGDLLVEVFSRLYKPKPAKITSEPKYEIPLFRLKSRK